MIIKKYPVFSNKKVEKWYVLDPDSYKITVSKILNESTAVGLDAQDAIAFCPATVYLKYWGDQRSLTNYLIHSIHESLHALSCHSKSVLPPVWEEGLTDYFAINVLGNYVGMTADAHMAFPYQVKVVNYLTDFISEKDLVSIYIEKNDDRLKKKIDEKFGADTYDKLMVDMNAVFYGASYSDGFQSNSEVDSAFIRIEELLNIKGE